MRSSSVVEVLFAVPQEIAQGLRSGVLVRRGGVIQVADGPSKGEVRLWLKEASSALQGSASAPSSTSLLGQQVSALQTTSFALLVGQAVTLGAIAIGFAVVNEKLKRIQATLGEILGELSRLREDVAWLDRRHDIQLEARLRGALDHAAWAVSTGRSEALVSVRATLVEVEHHYRALLDAMLAGRKAHRHARLYASYHGLLALAGLGRAQAESRMDGPSSATAALDFVVRSLGDADAGFRRPLGNLGANLDLLGLSHAHDQPIRAALGAMRETTDRARSQATILAFCSENRLSVDDWAQLGEDGPDEPHLVFIAPTKRNAQ